MPDRCMEEAPNVRCRRAVSDDIMIVQFLSGLTGQGHVHPHGLAGLLTLVKIAPCPEPFHAETPETLIK